MNVFFSLKDRRGWDGEVYRYLGVLIRFGFGGNRILEVKRRELRDSEIFFFSGEMFINMSLWREERGLNFSISGWVEFGLGFYCFLFFILISIL